MSDMGTSPTERADEATVERRIAPRVDLETPAHFHCGGTTTPHYGSVVNVSETGAFLETTDTATALGEALHLSFDLPDDYGPVEAVAEVVYRNPVARPRSALRAGVGLHFIAIEDGCRDRIRAYVEHHEARVDRFDRGLLGLHRQRPRGLQAEVA